jgi:dUTP pyrophosphatase
MAKFEIVSKYESAGLDLPVRKTEMAAGYDLAAADDYIIPSVFQLASEAEGLWPVEPDEFVTLE